MLRQLPYTNIIYTSIYNRDTIIILNLAVPIEGTRVAQIELDQYITCTCITFIMSPN